MSRKKKKILKKQRQKLVNLAVPMAIILSSLLTGVIATLVIINRNVYSNLVWAADSTVRVPRDLEKFLGGQDGCKEYRGTGTPTGIGLWGVYQVSQEKYAKIAYGCSWSLSSYIMAVKQDNFWQLVKPTEYFAPFKDSTNAGSGALPYCSQLEKYKIPKDIESFCIKEDGSAKSNDI